MTDFRAALLKYVFLPVPHTIKDGQPFPMACPNCSKVSGMPFIASTTMESGAIRVGMRCRECSHEWRYDMPIASEKKA
jgi:RNase P subunit RPR2